MTRRSTYRPISRPYFLSFSLLMTSILGILLLAACTTSRGEGPSAAESVPSEVKPPDPSAAAVSGEEASQERSPWEGVEEMGIAGSSGGSLLLSRESVVAFDSAEISALAGSPPPRAGGAATRVQRRAARRRASAEGSGHFVPNLTSSPGDKEVHRDQYAVIEESGFVRPLDMPLSTFSVDVDTAAYANVRRFLSASQTPPVDAVRIEEMINYFRYPSHGVADREVPFGVDLELFESPWNANNKLLRVSLQGHHVEPDAIPARNLVFLLDVSGSMSGPDRLPLVQYGLSRLTESLRKEDRVSIVVYAGASGLVLPATSGAAKSTILSAIDRLHAGGSTAGAEGIQLAYQTARAQFIPNGINRVILATDGDFNVGISSFAALVRMIEKERESGVELTVLGVGRGNLNDAMMEQLADHGNGNYAYLDRRSEATRVLVQQAAGTLVTIAKDVKIQVEWNPRRVAAYRLIGYENRRLADQDFEDDTKDAGEMGAGHHVTALYEVIPVGASSEGSIPEVPPLKYQSPSEPSEAASSPEWVSIALRYKRPDAGSGEGSQLIRTSYGGEASSLHSASESARFSAAVALFGMLLQGSEFAGEGSFSVVEDLARSALGSDEFGEREDFVRWVEVARNLN